MVRAYSLGRGAAGCGCGGTCGCGGKSGAVIGRFSAPRSNDAYRGGQVLLPGKGGRFMPWCATCHVLREGRQDPSGARVRALQSAWKHPVQRFNIEPSTSITGACSSSAQTQITNAIKFIHKNKKDIPTSCTAAMKNASDTLFLAKGDCVGNPRQIVIDKLADANFWIHCASGGECSKTGTMAFTVAVDTLDIHLCNKMWDGTVKDSTGATMSIGKKFIACVIVHEIMHCAGADESAASAISTSLGWGC